MTKVRDVQRESYVPLTGGFGNQLFQIAFGIYLNKQFGRKVVFDLDFGNPRKIDNSVAVNGIQFEYPLNILNQKRNKFHKFFAKSYSWNLVRGLIKKKRNVLSISILNFLTSSLIQLKLKKRIKVISAKNLGFDVDLDLSKEAIIYCGYFQTFIYASAPAVFEVLTNIRLRDFTEKYVDLQKQIKEKQPILLHVRLSDYLTEKQFGTPSLEYYKEAIKIMRNKKSPTDIWVISDDIQAAEVYLRDLIIEQNVRFVDQKGLSDLEVWDLMRNFAGYVISNSSFAWWAAFLRKEVDAPVCAPIPWFKGMKDPELLLPKDWIKVSSL